MFAAMAAGCATHGCMGGDRLAYLWWWGPVLLLCWALGVAANMMKEVGDE
jgi:hypothetical protein